MDGGGYEEDALDGVGGEGGGGGGCHLRVAGPGEMRCGFWYFILGHGGR